MEEEYYEKKEKKRRERERMEALLGRLLPSLAFPSKKKKIHFISAPLPSNTRKGAPFLVSSFHRRRRLTCTPAFILLLLHADFPSPRIALCSALRAEICSPPGAAPT
jgi:hypothetical protein